jgi:mRNA interferase MazF
MIEKVIQLFQSWFNLKPKLASKESHLVFKEGEIWWCSLGMNVGEEIYGKGPRFERPILILKKFTRNSFLGLALTSKEKRGSWYSPVTLGGMKRYGILNQVKTSDKKRLLNKVGTLSANEFVSIKQKFHEFYCL